MLKQILTTSALIAAVLLVRFIFRNRVPKRMLYALWLVVLLKLLLPGTLISLPVLPPEEKIAPVQAAAAQPAEISEQTAPAVQMPTQTAPANQQPLPAIPPITQTQEALKPAAKVLTSVQALQLIWVCGSVLLGLWMFASWLVFLIRLRKDRSFLGRHGKTRIYTSSAVKSPCLAGLIPAVYLTQDVLKNETTELILQHELTHLRHLDFLWAFCRTAAVIVYWWNPFVWAAAIVSKRDAELSCDEAVAAKLDTSARLAYANAILALAPRKQAALSLAGSPVRERILFLTKKQRMSVLCVILALVLVVSAAGCSVIELTQKKSGEITLPEQSVEDVQPPVKASPGRRCKTGEALVIGRYIRTEGGQDAFLFELNGQDTLAHLINWTGKDEPFRKMDTGDLIWVKYPMVPFEEDAQILTIHVMAAGKDHSKAPFHAEIPTEYLEKLATFEQMSKENAQVKDGWVLDADTLTDEKLLEIVLTGEIALAGENGFTFDDPRVLSSQELYMLFLARSDYDELTRDCLDEKSGNYVIPNTYISEKLSRYFKAFDFDITKVRDYAPEKDAVVTRQVSGFGGDRFTNMTEKTIDGNLVILTLDFFDNWEKTGNPYMRKTYALEFYDGGYYYLSAQADHAPQPNDGTYDVTQPLQAWELARTDGVQTGLTLVQLEDICGELTQGENGYTYFDSRNILYDIFDFSNATPTVQRIAYVGSVKDNEILYTTDREEAAFRGIRLGDPMESVLDKFPCKDLELENGKTQVLYGTEASDSYAKLHYIVDDCYGLSFYLNGQWRAEIYFSRVQQRVFRMEIFSENYWKSAEELAAEPAQQDDLTAYVVPFDPGMPVKTEEFTFPCGLHFGMSYEEALALCGDAACNEWVGEWGYRSFDCAGMQFSFHQIDGLIQVSLRSAADGGSAEQTPTIRNIQIGDSIESVFDRLPCTDRELKQWEVQMVYDDGAGHWAWLQYVAGSFYSLRIHTPEDYLIAITFARADNTVKSIDLNGPGGYNVFALGEINLGEND